MNRIRTFAVMTGLAVTLSALVPALQAQVFPGAGPGGGMRGPGPGGMMGPGMGMGMGPGGSQGGPLMVLLAPSVQKELKLKEDQKAKIYDFTQKMNQKNRDLAQARMFGGNVNPQAMMEAARQLRQESDKGVAKILDAKQKERFDQIVLQNEGPLAVARPEIAAKLRLNESQKEYVQGVMMQMRQEFVMTVRQGVATGQFNPSQMRELSTHLRKEAVKEIAKVIDRKQQKTFNSMLGERFDLTKLESETATAEAANTPAADGSKPVADGSKPAADGTTPAADGSKPAADASKPADTPQTKDAPAAATGTEPAKESAPSSDPKVPAGPAPGSTP